MAEFVVNNNDFLSTKLSLFFASKSLYLHMSFDIIEFQIPQLMSKLTQESYRYF